ncbi:T9SS type A sorting domain-containing protein [Riemerella columbina]|uniref:T9SS type A sorting domain-containing protein n=1 Tax=Riemerella columbina TaxID=103810 RepID=UPI00037530B6|nr:T9SS type A sorting domain-containing protein [Riemerella columbina]
MKKFYSLVAVLTITATATAQNLVQNFSFENDFSDWKAGFKSTYTAPEVITGGAQDGNKYVKYTPTSTTGFYQNISIEAGKEYILTFYYKAARGKDARIWCNFKNANNDVIYLNTDTANDPLRNNNKYLEATNDWTKHEIQFTAPNDIVSFDLAVRAYSGSNVSFDNFSLVKKENMSVYDLAGNKKETLVKNTVVENRLLFGAKGKVTIYNTNGQVVKSLEVKEGDAVNISSLPKGVYVVAGEVNGQKVSQKVIKK